MSVSNIPVGMGAHSCVSTQVIFPDSLFIVSPGYRVDVCMCAESFQLCLMLCNPTDCSPPGSPVRGILQARILEVGCHAPSSTHHDIHHLGPARTLKSSMAGLLLQPGSHCQAYIHLHSCLPSARNIWVSLLLQLENSQPFTTCHKIFPS